MLLLKTVSTYSTIKSFGVLAPFVSFRPPYCKVFVCVFFFGGRELSIFDSNSIEAQLQFSLDSPLSPAGFMHESRGVGEVYNNKNVKQNLVHAVNTNNNNEQ